MSFSVEEVEQSIAARFEHQVELHPARPAIVDKQRAYTYDELNRWANSIAHAITRATDAGPSRVAIYLDKGARYLAAILGVLKAGHAYVPIDPAFPRDRNLFLVQDSAAAVILTDARHAEAIREMGAGSATVVDIDTVSAAPDDQLNLNLQISPDALAYIIYTSGSTGRPKGVMQNQRNTLHGCMRRTNLQRITPEDRMTLFYSCSVMGSVYCIFGALLNGASLFPYDFREDGLNDFASWLDGNRITIYHSVASVFRQFAGGFEESLASGSVRLVIFGGERVFASDIAAARRIFSPRVEFFTGLGSTETGTIRHFLIGPETTIPSRVVPIGYAVEGVDIVLTDPDGNPVDPGEVGEINVRSRYLALGYWNNEEATHKAFAEVPGSGGVRNYRMGDLAELLPGSLLEHRGRKDFQVKIRGFRVEIGEVEATLQSHPSIKEGAVKAQEIGNDMQLVAYVVPHAGAEAAAIGVRELREFLRAKLPSYMVPAVFVGLEALPRTPNGKVDAKALPLPLPSNELADEPRVAPVSSAERRVVEVCCEILGRRPIGINENFFDIGGDSLSATRLVAQLYRQLGVNVSMRSVFAAKDLRELAREVEVATPGLLPRIGGDLQHAKPGARVAATPAQQRMWLIEQINPGTAAYNISNAVRLRGALDIGALERALNDIVARHGALRTVFQSDDSGLRQEVTPTARFALDITDLQELPAEARSEHALGLVRSELARSQDLARGPLFTCRLLKLSDQEHVLSLVFNHVVYDNIWSSRIFFQELGALYSAYSTGQDDSPLAPLDFQFVDYAAWERTRIDAGGFGEHFVYWRKQLEGLSSSLELPSDRERPAQPTFRGGQVTFRVPSEVRLGLVAFNRQHSATVFMTLIAVWQLLLQRYSGQDDIAVGTPTGRRYRAETEGMIGLFINNLVLRARFVDGMTFRDLIGQVRATCIDAFAHDEVPFETLVSELRPVRAAGAPPFFRHFFIHRNASQAAWTIPGLTVEPLGQHQGTSKFDLTLSVFENERDLTGTIEYGADLFDRETIERLAENYVQLLTAALDAPSTAVSHLEVMAPGERELVVRTWNQTSTPYPDLCVHQLFEAQAATHPDAVAVICRGERVTYRQLDERAERMAKDLRARGVDRDRLVAVCLSRSVDLLVSLLAVLKTGGAYVPLDPDYPPERLTSMLEDSQAEVLVSEAEVIGRFAHPTAELVLVGNGSAEPASGGAARLAHHVQLDDLAYVIYTSGSTGKPKGVQVTHRGLANFLNAMKQEPGLTKGDVLQSVTTVCFDIAGLELFLPLIVGATVVISDHEISLSPKALLDSLSEHRATALQATPITWRMLLDNGWSGTPEIKVLCGGEAMGKDVAERLLATGSEVWNLYGPTETTVWSAVGQVRTAADSGHVGRPIANTQLFVMSPAFAVQPIGVPGELMIGGDGLARGYLGRDDLTRERFIENSLGSGGRLYRTGDLAVRRPDGTIQFLGRADHQVKIRGFRIELGEIEAHLAQHLDVRQAVVIAREDTPGEKRLVAYCVPTGSTPASSEALHQHLKAALPHYMIPSAFVAMEALPLTPNGKVDRKRLPAPSYTAPVARADRGGGTARDDLDRSFLTVWEAVLGRTDVTIDDDFFALGGDSMMAIRLVKEMQKATGIEYPLSTLFTAPTIRQLVDRGGEAVERAASIVKLNAVGSGTPIYCLAGVQLYKPFAELFTDSPVFGIYARRELARIEAQDTGVTAQVPIDMLVETYTDAVARHSASQKLVLAGLSFGGLMALEVGIALKKRGFEVSQVVLFDTIPAGAYVRSLRKAVVDCAQMVATHGLVPTLKKLGGRLYTKLTLPPSERHGGAPPSVRRRESVQGRAFRSMSSSYDSRGKVYDCDVLLIKATRKELGIGASMKHDYGFGKMVAGRLDIAEVDADHRGMVNGVAVTRLFEIVANQLGSQVPPGGVMMPPSVRYYPPRG